MIAVKDAVRHGAHVASTDLARATSPRQAGA